MNGMLWMPEVARARIGELARTRGRVEVIVTGRELSVADARRYELLRPAVLRA